MGKTKKILKNFRVILVVIAVLLALAAISPSPFADGVAIRSVGTNSSAAIAGILSPSFDVPPTNRERILTINNQPIATPEDYYSFESSLKANRTITIKTDKGFYRLVTRDKIETIILNETEEKEITEEVFDEELNRTVNRTTTIIVNKTISRIVGVEPLGLSVYEAPKTNIRKGLDLEGGTRVLLQPETKLEDDDLDILIDNIKQRINVYGLSDIVVREAGDLSGNQYLLIEIPGAKEEEVKDLVSKQGKFEATIGNETVFKGGDDITYVCRSADCSGLDPFQGCGQISTGEWTCQFRFSISLSQEAAERQAELTKDLEVIIGSDGSSYLSEQLVLYLDNTPVDELNIGEDLKGRAVTEIQISGSGVGATQQQAVTNALDNMKELQTLMITGSLSVKLDIVKTDTISPLFGKEYMNNALFIGLLALVVVGVIAFIRYRRLSVAIPMIGTLAVEVLLLLGFAAAARNFMTIDLAAIAGMVIVIGTGVDHLIVITDETLRGDIDQIYDWKKRIKSAFAIIMVAYLTTFVAMVPLVFAGAGLLKGFALTTIIGVSIGVLIARPAYAAIIEILLKK